VTNHTAATLLHCSPNDCQHINLKKIIRQMQISPLTMAITLVEYPAREHTLYQPNNSYTFITDSFHYSDNVCSDGCMLGTETIKLLASVMFMTWSSFSTLTPTVTHLTCLTLLSTQLVKESKPLNFKICSKMSMKFGM